MITFKNFLSEARMAPLYHGTGKGGIALILRDGFKPATQHSNRKLNLGNRPSNQQGSSLIQRDQSGVSFTRQLRVARTFGRFVFEVDQQKLAHTYKIVPIQYFQDWGVGANKNFAKARAYEDSKGVNNEYEEFVLTNKNISPKFITALHYVSGYEITDDEKEMIQRLKETYPNIHFKEIIRK